MRMESKFGLPLETKSKDQISNSNLNILDLR